MAVPSASTRHMINRFSYGYTPGLHKAITKAGGPQEWFAAQLKPSKVSDEKADAMKAWYPYLRSSSRKRQQADRTTDLLISLILQIPNFTDGTATKTYCSVFPFLGPPLQLSDAAPFKIIPQSCP